MSDLDNPTTYVPIHSPTSSDDEVPLLPSGSQTKGSNKFSAAQTATLTFHYNIGIKGVGEAHTRLICRAAKEANLNEAQVKVNVAKKYKIIYCFTCMQ